ncbi:MAG: hypothetical protein ACYTG7_16000 [Planctomycetota bacterium]|jgi:hypothetical protein
MTRTIKEIKGWSMFPEGEADTAQLPDGASMPLPATNEFQIMDIRIVDKGGDAYLLVWKEEHEDSEHEEHFQSLERAEKAAEEYFGIQPKDWQFI